MLRERRLVQHPDALRVQLRLDLKQAVWLTPGASAGEGCRAISVTEPTRRVAPAEAVGADLNAR
jgi:hypothetical protein